MRILTWANSPQAMRRINGILTLFWLAMIPISVATGWIGSVTYVAALSLWALVSGHWSAWQAARVEVRQDEDADVSEVLAELRRLLSVPTPKGSQFTPKGSIHPPQDSQSSSAPSSPPTTDNAISNGAACPAFSDSST